MRDLQHITLLELLPASIAQDAGVRAAAEAVDSELQAATACIANVSIIPRIREIVDSAIIDLLAWQFHVDFYDAGAPVEKRRELVEKSLDWHTRKGTPAVVEEVVTAALSDATVTEWFDFGGEPYFFRVTTYLPLSNESDIRRLLDAIYSVKNTRSWLEYIESITRARLMMYFGAGLVLYDKVDISLRSPDEPPFVDKEKQKIEVFVIAFPLYRGRIATYAEDYDPAIVHIGVYEGLDGEIITRGEMM